MARFFIDRPVFAWVLAIITMLTGILAINNLPIEQYPKVAPPTVSIDANYPGASAKSVHAEVWRRIRRLVDRRPDPAAPQFRWMPSRLTAWTAPNFFQHASSFSLAL